MTLTVAEEVKNCTPKPYYYIIVAYVLDSDLCNYKSNSNTHL